MNQEKPLIQIKDLRKQFLTSKGLLTAVDTLNLDIFSGETLGLVGESGCGKSTLGKLILNLETPSHGSLLFDGKNLSTFSKPALLQFRREAQIIFQDPYSSLNPRMTAQDIVSEPFEIHRLPLNTEEIKRLFLQVNLNPSYLKRFPHELSGGQRQRIGIARAIALNPRFIVCDEPISALDVSVQAQIVNLLKNLQKELGLTYLFISHDLRMVKYIADRIGVMYLGNLVELAKTPDLSLSPLHPYTQALFSAIPLPDPILEKKRERIVLKGEIPSAVTPPPGCPFSTRCPKAFGLCSKIKPELQQIRDGQWVACHLY